MNAIYHILGFPLGYIMWAIYRLVNNYGVAILLFTLVTKLLLYPVSVHQQKSTAKMASFQPKLQALQKKYANNKEKMQEEQMKLYSEEGVNPMGSCLPLLIQMPILFGIIDVVYRPLTHIMHLSTSTISSASAIAKKVFIAVSKNPNATEVARHTAENALKTFDKSLQQQLFIMQAYELDKSKFDSVPAFVSHASNFDMYMFGHAINLGANPTWGWNLMVLIPILAGLSQLLVTVYMQWYQKKTNPAMQSMAAMNSVMYMMPVVSVMFAFGFPAGVGFYWIAQSIFSFGQSVLLNKIYTPERVAELNKISDAKKKKNRKKKGPSYMQRVMEQQKAMQNGETVPVPQRIQTTVTYDENGEEIKLSKTAQKELNSKLIAEARRRHAEKYGDSYDENE